MVAGTSSDELVARARVGASPDFLTTAVALSTSDRASPEPSHVKSLRLCLIDYLPHSCFPTAHGQLPLRSRAVKDQTSVYQQACTLALACSGRSTVWGKRHCGGGGLCAGNRWSRAWPRAMRCGETIPFCMITLYMFTSFRPSSARYSISSFVYRLG